MFIEDLVEQYSEEVQALGIDLECPYSGYEVKALMDRCQSYRERQELVKRIEELEKRVSTLECEGGIQVY